MPETDDGLPSVEKEVDKHVTLAVSKVANDRWEQIADTLGVSTTDINHKSSEVNLNDVIRSWTMAAKTTPTVGDLLKACALNGVERPAIAKKYKEIEPLMPK